MLMIQIQQNINILFKNEGKKMVLKPERSKGFY